MNKPKIELKKLKLFKGHDGMTGMNADIWIAGVKCLHVYDSAHGGCFEYHDYQYNSKNPNRIKALIKTFNDYIKTLPERTSTYGDKTFSFKVDMDIYIDDLVQEKERLRLNKRIIILMQTAIVIGDADMSNISYFKMKQPLQDMAKDRLQSHVGNVKINYCNNNVKILNTNLQALGITT